MKHKYGLEKVSVSALSVILFLLAALAIFLSAREVRRVDVCMKDQARIEESRRICQREGQALIAASDYLTSEAWHFIATQKEAHMANYWEEIYGTKERERALEALLELSLTDEERRLFSEAKQVSDELVNGEAWAMRMIAEAMGIGPDSLPEGVAKVELSPRERLLSPEQKRQTALGYIFGEEYTSAKTTIIGDINQARSLLSERKEREMETAEAATNAALAATQFYNGMVLLYLTLSLFLYYVLATRPFHRYAVALRQMEGRGFAPLSPEGSKDTRDFAEAYNQIYADWRKKNNSLEEERFRFHIALENTQIIVYEYSPDADVYEAYGTLGDPAGEEERGGVPNERKYGDFLKEKAAAIAGEDGAGKLRRLAESGGGTLELQVEFGGNKIWSRITARPVYDEAGRLQKLIGKIINIQSEKEKEFALEAVRSQDRLTGFYDRGAGVRLVRDYMAKKPPEEICGIMLLDMDGFKQINAEEGSVFADAVLQDVADLIRAYTDEDDILVRMGGDEFMLFLKNCPKSKATVLGPKIAAAVSGLSPEQNPAIRISASIGMCVTEVVDEYSGLYRCAESTLKYVKAHGKGRAACYLDTSNELGVMLTQMYPDRHFLNEIDHPDGAAEDLVSFALDLLGKAKNLDDAIYLLIARVGKRYRLDRILIMDVDQEYMSCRFSYQWVSEPRHGRSGKLVYLGKEDFDRLSASYDEDGLCESYLLKGDYGLKSILHAAIWNLGSYGGAMSFEKKEEGYVWSEEERHLLGELVKIIASFILKARADAVSRAKTDFLSRMSHEIRTPMNAITGMTAIARHYTDNPEKIADCLSKIESSSSYLLSLINDILDMSRIESGKMELSLAPLELDSQLQGLSVLVQPQMEAKKLRFSIDNGFAGGRPLMADGLRLNQVLVNLLGNAVKFTPEGGRVTLRVSEERRTDADAVLRFSVADTGIGVSREAQERIFNSFEQASSDTAASYGGTGLGLAISSRLVQLMGGALKVDSEPGRGAEFYFTLCLSFAQSGETVCHPGAQAGRAGRTERLPGYDPHGKRILLVEDNELNREIAKELLELHGFEVGTASDGRRAVEQFKENPPGYYDAILMDIRMPVMDGFSASRLIRTMEKEDSRTVPIIAMTANAFDEDMKKSLESGMNGHLSKPIEVELLLKTLETCIESGGR